MYFIISHYDAFLFVNHGIKSKIKQICFKHVIYEALKQ